MAYHMSGVLVQRSTQSMRPREPAPPGRSITISSRMMSTRMLRPRENNAINGTYVVNGLGVVSRSSAAAAATVTRVSAKAAADKYLDLVAAHRGQQKYLEGLLTQIGIDMKKLQIQIKATALRNPKAASPLQAQLLVLQKDATVIIAAIKDCASKANASAAAAIENGATPTEVQQANTSAGTSSGSADISTSYSSSVAPQRTDTTDTVTADVSPTDSAIETNTPSVAPDGTLVPGSDAKVVETPAVTEPGNPTPPVTASSGGGLSLGEVLIGAGLLWAGGKYVFKWW